MDRLGRLLRALAAPGFARHPRMRLTLAPEVLGGLLAVVALVAAVGNAGALAAVLADVTHPGSLGGWLPALATLLGAALGLVADVGVGLGGWVLPRQPRRGAELVVAGLLGALLATIALGVAASSLAATLGYLAVLAVVYVLVTVTAARAMRPPLREAESGLGDAPAVLEAAPAPPGRAPVPWVWPTEPRQPAVWHRADPEGPAPDATAVRSGEPAHPAGTPGDPT